MKLFTIISRRYAWLIAIALMIAIIIGGLLLTFRNSVESTMSNAEAKRWINAFSPNLIDPASPICVELSPLATGYIKNKILPENIFTFTPSVKGKTTLSDDKRLLMFTPSRELKSGKKYKCRVAMNKLIGIDSLRPFTFTFVTERRQTRFKNITMSVDPDDTSNISVSGEIEYNSIIGDSICSIPGFITCDAIGSNVIIGDNTDHFKRHFTIKGIKRHNKRYNVHLKTNPLHGFCGAMERVEVPSVQEFMLISARRIECAEPYIELEFSKPLSTQQELDGLITIDKIRDIKIHRQGTNVKIYYKRTGLACLELHLSELIKDIDGQCLDADVIQKFETEIIPPAVELDFDGSILSNSHNLRLPFRAVNLAAVDIKVIKIPTDNVMYYLQTNSLKYCETLRRYGQLIYHRTVRLDGDKKIDLHQWNNFSVDLKGLFKKDPGAIYNINLSFRKAYSLYDKTHVEDFDIIDGLTPDDIEEWNSDYSYYWNKAPDCDWTLYDWQESEDPTKASYYMESSRMAECQLMVSELGVVAKRGHDNVLDVAVLNLNTATPVDGATIKAYNFQLQPLATATTDTNGFAHFKTSTRVYILRVTDGHSTTYLKVDEGGELSTSRFDVTGRASKHSIKGFTYGDRGIWRPGDDINLTLILEDKDRKLPTNYPVVMELLDPLNRVYSRHTSNQGIDGFYTFRVSTSTNVPTGLWRARFLVGNEVFNHNVQIETIKPNRLKINIETPQFLQVNTPSQIGVSARWLAGPVAARLNTRLDMTLYSDPSPFKDFKEYIFSNPLVEFTSTSKNMIKGKTDSLGKLIKRYTPGTDKDAPGMLVANITAHVTETGGDKSIMSKSVRYSPFGVYLGIDIGKREFSTGRDIQLPLVAVNQLGARMKKRSLSYKIYKINTDWWWEGNVQDLNHYVKSTSADVAFSGTVDINDGYGTLSFKVEDADWGRYLVLVRDTNGGHATGGTIFVDTPGSIGKSYNEDKDSSTSLSFGLDKKCYTTGDIAKVYLPRCKGGRVLLSVEDDSRIISKRWVTTSATTETTVQLQITSAIAPNFYITATLVRPNNSAVDKTPIRLFGVKGATVIDPKSRLEPVINIPSELHPGQDFTVKISEATNRTMTYTLAIVDEGLLDISNFRTPSPWSTMYQRRALGVNTWDMYDDVIGEFGANFKSVLSIGGDMAVRQSAGKEKRFNPVVKFLGPFTLPGGSRSHRISMPNYVGSVRVMVVAGHNGAYGNADKTVKVSSPLMVLPTLPASLACTDSLLLPVNVFSTREEIKDVQLSVSVTGPAKLVSSPTQKLLFNEPGNITTNFKLVCNSALEGKSRIIVTARSGSFSACDTTYIDIINPQPRLNDVQQATVPPGKTFTWDIKRGCELISLELATLPAVNYGQLMNYMIYYPYTCSEQLTSKLLFMLYSRRYMDMEQKNICDRQIPSLLKQISSRILTSGGVSYWPGIDKSHEWVSSMVAIAFSEAIRQGFEIDNKVYQALLNYLDRTSGAYRYDNKTSLIQAYRLYALTKANRHPAADMNRLRESKGLSRSAAFVLASSYSIIGRNDVALVLLERARQSPSIDSPLSFYSPLRDKALEMEALTLCSDRSAAAKLSREIASSLNNEQGTTQEIALATIAFDAFAGSSSPQPVKATINCDGNKTKLTNVGNLYNTPIPCLTKQVSITNDGNIPLELSICTVRQLPCDKKLNTTSKSIKMSINYIDENGKRIDPSKLSANTTFKAIINVRNLGNEVENMAVCYRIPAGWEFVRSNDIHDNEMPYDYCDIRDTDARYYLPLAAGANVTFTLELRAAYAGSFLLPASSCEDMYNTARCANTNSSRVSIL